MNNLVATEIQKKEHTGYRIKSLITKDNSIEN